MLALIGGNQPEMLPRRHHRNYGKQRTFEQHILMDHIHVFVRAHRQLIGQIKNLALISPLQRKLDQCGEKDRSEAGSFFVSSIACMPTLCHH